MVCLQAQYVYSNGKLFDNGKLSGPFSVVFYNVLSTDTSASSGLMPSFAVQSQCMGRSVKAPRGRLASGPGLLKHTL